MQIDVMTNEDVMTELKQRGQPTFGTPQERKDRLKKAHGTYFIYSLINIYFQNISYNNIIFLLGIEGSSIPT